MSNTDSSTTTTSERMRQLNDELEQAIVEKEQLKLSMNTTVEVYRKKVNDREKQIEDLGGAYELLLARIARWGALLDHDSMLFCIQA